MSKSRQAVRDAVREELFPTLRTPQQQQLRNEYHVGPLSQGARRRLFTAPSVVAALERLVKTLGSVSQVARHLNMSRTFLSMVLSGARTPSRELAEQLGFTPVLLYLRNLEPNAERWAVREAEESDAAEAD
jgi:hypothetical protein